MQYSSILKTTTVRSLAFAGVLIIGATGAAHADGEQGHGDSMQRPSAAVQSPAAPREAYDNRGGSASGNEAAKRPNQSLGGQMRYKDDGRKNQGSGNQGPTNQGPGADSHGH